jgi:thymidylate synthase (FAD)
MDRVVELEIVEPRTEIVTRRAREYPEQWAFEALEHIEECGRESHKSEHRIKPGSAEPFVKKLIHKLGHEGILEHVALTVRFIGSRSFSHQHVRHRLCSHVQESQRYCDYSNDTKTPRLKVVIPPSIGSLPTGTLVCLEADGILSDQEQLLMQEPDAHRAHPIDATGNLGRYLLCALCCYATYLELRDKGIPAEDAREALLNGTKTEVVTTINLSSLRNYFRKRLDKHAQWQIKMLARDVYNWFKQYMPVVVEDLKTHSGEDIV